MELKFKLPFYTIDTKRLSKSDAITVVFHLVYDINIFWVSHNLHENMWAQIK